MKENKKNEIGQDQQSQKKELENIRKCEKCLNNYDLEKVRDDKPDLGYWDESVYLKICVACYHKGNLKPFTGIDQVKNHKWLIMYKGYQDAKGKSCGLPNCNETKNLLDVKADDNFKLGGLICKEHFKQVGFKLIGSWVKTWEREFEPKKTKWETPTNRDEAIASWEEYKKMVNFNQYGSPADRLWHVERWASKCGLTWKEAEKLMRA